jgi:hypothetical protein
VRSDETQEHAEAEDRFKREYHDEDHNQKQDNRDGDTPWSPNMVWVPLVGRALPNLMQGTFVRHLAAV